MCIRISEHPIVDYPKHELVEITINGVPCKAYAGEPIAAALLANNVKGFRYTTKRKEPRSLFCGIGQCNDCVVIVNGQPNVRSCITMVEAGMAIEVQDGLGRMGVEC
jgi:aerobic-type carbon monoxide dehydrogenase small subunit (CoxS/CutS family)